MRQQPYNGRTGALSLYVDDARYTICHLLLLLLPDELADFLRRRPLVHYLVSFRGRRA
jgi:hypothetical protein